mmetsp:Transcript_41728/g.131533  ORF Transcript_41728/g.131533 Transcript_41728/m.131533 type:complete len:98 (+) Transcript_41728:639-932(+)
MGARYLICTLERTWAMNPSADRMNVICNCQNLTFSNYEHAMCLICLEILGEQYPDNMQYCFMFPVCLFSLSHPFDYFPSGWLDHASDHGYWTADDVR